MIWFQVHYIMNKWYIHHPYMREPSLLIFPKKIKNKNKHKKS